MKNHNSVHANAAVMQNK